MTNVSKRGEDEEHRLKPVLLAAVRAVLDAAAAKG